MITSRSIVFGSLAALVVGLAYGCSSAPSSLYDDENIGGAGGNGKASTKRPKEDPPEPTGGSKTTRELGLVGGAGGQAVIVKQPITCDVKSKLPELIGFLIARAAGADLSKVKTLCNQLTACENATAADKAQITSICTELSTPDPQTGTAGATQGFTYPDNGGAGGIVFGFSPGPLLGQ